MNTERIYPLPHFRYGLTHNRRQELKTALADVPSPAIRQPLQAVDLLDIGLPLTWVAKATGVTPPTVADWFTRFAHGGVGALFHR